MGEFDHEVKELITKLHPQRVAQDTTLIFYGSSSLRLWENYVSDLNLKGNVANAAFGGSTIPECRRYFDELILPLQPKALFFYCGDNDIGKGATTEETEKNYKDFYHMVKEKLPDLVFISLSVKPSPIRNELLPAFKQLNESIEAFLEPMPKSYFISIFDEMLNNEGLSREVLFIEDGLHMNQKGYQLWSDKITPALNGILAKEGLL